MKVKAFLSGGTLKIIAIITMLIDHIGAVILYNMLHFSNGLIVEDNISILYGICRNIGRISFPIFCFLLVEGFVHTSNVRKYADRLLLFAFLSEIPFDLALKGTLFYTESQNVFFTLWIGLLVLIGLKWTEKIEKTWRFILGRSLVLIAGIAASILLHTDYEVFGIVSIAVLYLFRYSKKYQIFLGASSFLWEPDAILAFVPIFFYNGERGRNLRYLFYVFYPVHLLILYFISIYI